MRLIQVVIPPLIGEFTYKLPDNVEFGEIGQKINVSFGNRMASGFVVRQLESNEREDLSFNPENLKEVERDTRYNLCFLPEQLSFFTWIANYYGDTLSNVLDTAIPKIVHAKVRKVAKLTPNYQTLAESLKGQAQKKLVECLVAHGNGIPVPILSSQYKINGGTVKRLEEFGVITLESETEESVDDFLVDLTNYPDKKNDITLNEHQEIASRAIIDACNSGVSEAFLLHGVTGSGKTEVYVEAMRKVLEQGKSVLMIVPEIALTPQLIDRLGHRLGTKFAVLHSGLKPSSRWQAWQDLLHGRIRVAVGVRSAIFAPIKDLGLIIVDEEHDSSFKQSDGLRYNARDLAVLRGKLEGCPIVLGSATPSLESFSLSEQEKYTYLTLPFRPFKESSVDIQIVDLGKLQAREMPSSNISPQLFKAISEALSKKEQIFILYNRRGFASYLQCEICSSIVACPNCSVTLTYHKSKEVLICHYCNLTRHFIKDCMKCSTESAPDTPKKFATLVPRGAGTERVFSEVKSLFPRATVARLDRDSSSKLSDLEQTLSDVRAGKVDILVGTQMIAKGHDLPNVTLVGVVDCDVGLHFPDFRASERTFQLLTQVAGRSGRGSKSGVVILQTRVPKNPSIQHTLNKDYLGFAKKELLERETFQYPPFARLMRIVASSQDPNLPPQLLKELKEISQTYLSENNIACKMLGPSSAPLAKIKNRYRWQLIIKSQSSSNLNKLLHVLRRIKFKNKNKIRLTFDIDPQDML